MKLTQQQLKQLIKEEIVAVLKEGGTDKAINAARAIMNNIRGLIDQIDGIVLSHPDLDLDESLKLDIESLRSGETAVSARFVAIQGEPVDQDEQGLN
jgi:beta-lactamase superfamily II metal-dependent hydrolase